jgi:hypothetical protein
MRIVFVHGINQGGKSEAQLRTEWIPGLVEGSGGAFKPTDHELFFPFYGDALDGFVNAQAATESIDILTRGAGDSGPLNEAEQMQAAIIRDLVAEARDRGMITQSQIDAVSPGPEIIERGISDWGVVHGLIGVLSLIPGVQSGVISLVLKQVSVYLNSTAARRVVDDIVQRAIQPPCVVLAHSLGSVVAYQVLRKRQGAAANIPLYVTLGSPLGIKTIRNAIAPTTWPSGLGAWFNARDARDVVSMYGLGPEAFTPGDRTIENPQPITNNGADSHNITGYLAVPLVAKRIMKALK